jgi:Tol biopolymer transport system component
LNIASGERRELTKNDAVQPAWSPSGERIAFWSTDEGGIRDIKTISAQGGEIVSVTNDSAFDWNPVWSPDGKFLYFASNRGGSMNFWRIAVDEKTGAPQGIPQPFTMPSVYSQNLTFSGNDKFFAYVQKVTSSQIIEAGFDSKTETVSKDVTKITQSARYDRNPWVSPDGEWIAFDAIKDKQEDLFVMKRDGSNVRQLTNDRNKDRAPRWSPDGKKLIFYSDRSGSYENWTINPDGSGLTQISVDSKPYALLSFWSPNGEKILQNVTKGYPKIFDAGKPFAGQTPYQIPSNANSDVWLMAYDWSPDGNKIAAMHLGKEKDTSGVFVYSLTSQKYEASVDFGESPVWLSDNRRLIFFDKNKVFLLDAQTAKTKE